MDTFSNQRKRMYPYKFKHGLKNLNGFYIKKRVHFTYNKLIYLRMGTFKIKKIEKLYEWVHLRLKN